MIIMFDNYSYLSKKIILKMFDNKYKSISKISIIKEFLYLINTYHKVKDLTLYNKKQFRNYLFYNNLLEDYECFLGLNIQSYNKLNELYSKFSILQRKEKINKIF